MSDDTTKDAERRGYAKGYIAGCRRKEKGISAETRQRRADAFFLRAMLASLPFALAQKTWKRGGKPISTLGERAELAADAATAAVEAARRRCVL